MAATKWIGFKHVNGKVYLCPETEVFNLVNIGEALQVLATGFEPYKVATAMNGMGMTPEMRDVHKHIMSKGKVGRPMRKVLCVETGKVYNSVMETARAVGASVGNLGNHLNHPDMFKTVKGHTFRYYVEGQQI